MMAERDQAGSQPFSPVIARAMDRHLDVLDAGGKIPRDRQCEDFASIPSVELGNAVPL